MSYKVEYYFDKNVLVKESIKDWFKLWAKNEREAIVDRQNFIYALQSFYCNKCKAPGFSNYNSPQYPNNCC